MLPAGAGVGGWEGPTEGFLGKDASCAFMSGGEVSTLPIWPEDREGFLFGE